MPIKIDVSPILRDVGDILEIEVQEELSFPEDDLILTAPVKLKGQLINTGENLLLRARVFAAVKMDCSRCAGSFDHPLDIDLEEEFVRDAGKVPSDMVFKIDKDNTIDLFEVIRQNIITELPIQPLCEKEER